ncbi:MAG: glycosyltransferase family 4 protein, partial [Candidatus Methanospirareceae archaeon]
PKGGISYGFDLSMRRLKEKLKDIDVLHIHHAATSSEFVIPFSEISEEIPIVNTFHIPISDPLRSIPVKMLIITLARLYSNHSRKFISVSEEVAKILRRYSDNETVVIPNGVDINKFRPREDGKKQRDDGDGNGRRVCLGYLGRLSREKNIVSMIKAVKMMKEEVFLKIAGTGPLYKKVKSMEDERIKVLGYVKDASAFYQSIDVFLLPSKFEAQPIALLEAMASGLPIVATDVGDNKYFIDGNGILCGTSAKEIKEAIEEIIKGDLQKMGSLSRKKIENDYSWEKIAQRTLKVYKAIIK